MADYLGDSEDGVKPYERSGEYDFVALGDLGDIFLFEAALFDLDGLPSGRGLLKEFGGARLGITVTLGQYDDPEDPGAKGGYIPANREIVWDPHYWGGEQQEVPSGAIALVILGPIDRIAPPPIFLAHEMIHAWHDLIVEEMPPCPEGMTEEEWEEELTKGGTGDDMLYTESRIRVEWRNAYGGSLVWWANAAIPGQRYGVPIIVPTLPGEYEEED